MADLTKGRKTDKFNPEDTVLPTLRSLPALASTTYYAGAMVGANGAGYAAIATDGATHMIGRCEAHIDNSSGGLGAVNVPIRPGVYFWNTALASYPVTQAYVALQCYAEDNHTVGYSSVTGKYPYAGIALYIRADGQVAVLMGLKQPTAANDFSSVQFHRVVLGVVTTNIADLTAFTVASYDGLTYAAGQQVLLLGQTTVAQNGPYFVGSVSGGVAALTRPSWWAKGMAIPRGAVIEVAGAGTAYGGTRYKSFVTTATKLVDTDSPLLYPQTIKGSKTLSSTAGTVTTLSITTQAKLFVMDITTLDKTAIGTITTGADQAGQIVFAGYGNDVIKYHVINW